MKKTIFAGAVALGLTATTAFAAPVQVLETNAPFPGYADTLGAVKANGDLKNDIGTAEVGTTIINAALAAPNDLVDAIYFTVAAGTKITSVKLNTSGADVELQAQLLDSTGTTVFDTVFTSNKTVDLLPSLFVGELSADTYNFALSFYGTVADGAQLTWTSTSVIEALPTTPVPLPAGLPLMLAGFGGLALLRRTKRG